MPAPVVGPPGPWTLNANISSVGLAAPFIIAVDFGDGSDVVYRLPALGPGGFGSWTVGPVSHTYAPGEYDVIIKAIEISGAAAQDVVPIVVVDGSGTCADPWQVDTGTTFEFEVTDAGEGYSVVFEFVPPADGTYSFQLNHVSGSIGAAGNVTDTACAGTPLVEFGITCGDGTLTEGVPYFVNLTIAGSPGRYTLSIASGSCP